MQSLPEVTDASDVSLVFELQSKLQKERYLYIDVRYVFLISTDSSYFINILTVFRKHCGELAVESNSMCAIQLNDLNMLKKTDCLLFVRKQR